MSPRSKISERVSDSSHGHPCVRAQERGAAGPPPMHAFGHLRPAGSPRLVRSGGRPLGPDPRDASECEKQVEEVPVVSHTKTPRGRKFLTSLGGRRVPPCSFAKERPQIRHVKV